MYYVDIFAHELVKEKDINSPPERYYEYRKGIDGVITETYIAYYNPLKLIDFSYTVDEDRSLLHIKRKLYLDKYGISANAQLYAYTVPPEWYEEQISKID